MTANPNLATDQKSLGKWGAFIDDNTDRQDSLICSLKRRAAAAKRKAARPWLSRLELSQKPAPWRVDAARLRFGQDRDRFLRSDLGKRDNFLESRDSAVFDTIDKHVWLPWQVAAVEYYAFGSWSLSPLRYSLPVGLVGSAS